MKPARAATRRHLPTSPFNVPHVDEPVEQFAEHDRVTHDRYGLGSVVSVEDDAAAITVDFGSRLIRLAIPCAKLSKL
jgi:hypothetical protein